MQYACIALHAATQLILVPRLQAEPPATFPAAAASSAAPAQAPETL